MQLAFWGIACLTLSLVFIRRPVVVVLAALSLWCLVPGAAAHLLTGEDAGLLAFQPAVVLVLVAVALSVLFTPHFLGAAVKARAEWTVLLGLVSSVGLATGYLNGLGLSSITTAVNQVVGPVLLFFLIGAVVLEVPDHVELIRRWMLGLAVVESVLSIGQKLAGSPLVYEADYAAQVFRRTSPDRWMGTFDHPLVLSLFLVLAIFWLTGLRRPWMAIALMPLFGAGILLSQSRVGVLAALVGIGYFVLRSRVPFAHRLMVMSLVAACAAAAVRLGAVEGLLARVEDDTGSSTARQIALEYFVDHFRSFAWLGRGLNASFDVSDGAGLGTSFESAFLMYAIDLGFVVAVLYFAVMGWTVLRSAGRSKSAGLTGAAAAAVAVPQTFSALSGLTAAPALVWTACSLAGFCALGRPRPGAAARNRRPAQALRPRPGARGRVPRRDPAPARR